MGTMNGESRWVESNREPGCRVAAPYSESSEGGQAYTFGTSDAAALISHEALKCYENLKEIFVNEIGSLPDERNRSIVRTLSSLYFCATIVSTTKQSV